MLRNVCVARDDDIFPTTQFLIDKGIQAKLPGFFPILLDDLSSQSCRILDGLPSWTLLGRARPATIGFAAVAADSPAQMRQAAC